MLGLAAVLSASVNANAYDFESDGMFYNILSQDGKTVEVTYRDTEYGSYSGDVAIPEQVTYNNKTYRVTTIGHFAFHNCSELTSIAIPSSITLIDDGAFLNCEGLTEVYIDDLSAWLNIDIITSYSTYSYSPLYYAHNLYLDGELVTDLVIPDGTTEIKDYAFQGGRCFKSVTIPNSVTSIGVHAFSDCTGLTAVNISDLSAWMNIDFATSASNPLYTPTNVYHNLYLNGELVTNLVIPDGTTEIKDYAFAYGNFKSVTIPGSVTSIGNGAFEDCANLTSIEIPNSVTAIGSAAFAQSGLTSVEIPGSVTSMSRAFRGCANLSSVTMLDGVVSISEFAFSECENLTSVEIPGSVTSIERNAFSNCFELSSIDISNSVTSIGQYAFGGCTKLESVVIPNSVTAIEMGTFNSCYNLASITIPNSVTSIGVIAFRDCRSLTSLTIPGSVTSIGSSALRGCTGLTEINSLNPVPPTVSFTSFDNQNYTTATLNVPNGSLSAYQSAEGWKDFLDIRETDFSGVEEMADANISVTAENGNIVVSGADNDTIEVYNVNGQLVYSGTETTVGGLANGIYIVRVDGQTFKVCAGR